MFKNFRIDIQRKYVLIVLAILVFLAVVYRFLPFFQELVSPDQKIELRERKLIKYRKMVETGQDLDKRLAVSNKTFKELEARLLTGKTPALAAVEIQKIFHKIANKSNVQVKKVKILKPRELDQESYLSIPVEFFILPTIRQLKEILYRIESSPKHLTVRKVRTQYSGNQSRCYITIAGFMKRAKS